MREIKFRAWDGANMHENVSPWRHDFVISNTWHRCEKSSGTGIFGSGGNYAEMLVPAVRFTELMQFTGLKDKNGKEICEGDIVRFKTYGDEKHFGEIALEVKISTDYGARPYMPVWGYFNWVSRESEIIGNIYENPELIK